MHCPDRRPSRTTGFTLLELIVAVAIFAIVGTLAVGGLHSVLQADRITQDQSTRLAEVEVMLALLERDLRHAVPVAPRDQFGDRQPPLSYSPYTEPQALRLVRAGLGGDRRLARVEWRITPTGLERYSSSIIDGAPEDAGTTRQFLRTAGTGSHREWNQNGRRETPQAIRFAFVSRQTGETRADWPPVGAGTTADNAPVPAQVILAFEDPELGAIERRIALPRRP